MSLENQLETKRGENDGNLEAADRNGILAVGSNAPNYALANESKLLLSSER